MVFISVEEGSNPVDNMVIYIYTGCPKKSVPILQGCHSICIDFIHPLFGRIDVIDNVMCNLN